MAKTLAEKFIAEIGEQELRPPLYNSSMLVHRSAWHTQKYFSKYYDEPTPYPLLLLLNQSEGLIFLTVTKEQRLAREIFKKYWQNESFLTKREALFHHLAQEVDERVARLSYDYLAGASVAEISQSLDKLGQVTWEMNAAAFFSIYFDKQNCESLIKELNINISQARLDQIWEQAVTPVGLSFEKKRRLYLLNLITQGRSWAEIAELCQHFDTAYDAVSPLEVVAEKLRAEYGDYTAERAKAETRAELTGVEQRQQSYQDWRQTLSEEEQKIVEFVQYLIELRDTRKDFIMKAVTAFYKVGERFFAEAGLPKELIFFVSTEELMAGPTYLREQQNEIEKRKEGVVLLVSYDGKQEMEYGTFGKNKKIINDFYLSQHSQSANQLSATGGQILRGQPGSRGQVCGRVQVIQNLLREKHKLQAGDILVTGMTRPEYVPLMKIAGGIITDEGGITCHAAIVSRELGVPCIIGTKIATQVLKDGMMVEVDADEGVVRILHE